jgi:protein lysine acetyltransferase
MSCSTQEAYWPERAIESRWPWTAKRRISGVGHHRPMHARYAAGVTIRPLRRGETKVVQAVFDQLGAQSRLLRFGGAKTALSAAELDELTQIDGRRHALVAFAGTRPIGIARLARDAEEPATAEVACAVVDEWQGRGVGTALLGQLTADARAAGVTRLRAFLHVENRGSLGLLRCVATIVETRLSGSELEILAVPG